MSIRADWRWQGQETYMQGLALCWKPYHRYSESWDHDHCEFCWAKFSEVPSDADALTEGYASSDSHRWVCRQCFDDFRQKFEWTIICA